MSSVITVRDVHAVLQDLAPDGLAETWDNVGLLVGSPEAAVTGVMVALDPTVDAVRQARAAECEVLVTHHPAIFRPIKNVLTDTPGGAFLAEAIRAGIAVIACHTSYDSAERGVSALLAAGLGLTDIRPLAPSPLYSQCGLGSLGDFNRPIGPDELVARLRAYCDPPWILSAGARPQAVSRVAVCGGSGSDMAELALAQGAQVYITAEVKHHTARWAEEAGLWLLDAGHFPTENPAMPLLADKLRRGLAGRGRDIPVLPARQSAPLTLLER